MCMHIRRIISSTYIAIVKTVLTPISITTMIFATTKIVDTVASHFLSLMNKVKIHIILHLSEIMVDFGPISTFNIER